MNSQELKNELENMKDTTSLKEIQEYVNHMIEVRGFDQETPKDVMLLLTEEVGELAKEVRKTTDIKLDVHSTRKAELGDEIADVFMYILSMCKATNVDLLEAFKKKEEKNFLRTWK